MLAHDLTGDDTSDLATSDDLVSNADGRLRTIIADGAYDGTPVYEQIRRAPPRSPPRIVVPPRANATLPGSLGSGAWPGRGARKRLWL